MLVSFDMKCPHCSYKYPNVFCRKDEVDTRRCGKCKTLLVKLPAATKTTFRFADRRLKRHVR